MPDGAQIKSELSAINMSAFLSLSKEQQAKTAYGDITKLNNASKAKNFEEYWLYSVGQTLYGKFIDGYSKKMWMLEDNKLIDDFTWSPKGVTIKEGPRECWDTAISAYPIAINGYDDYFGFATAGVKVLLNTRIEKYDIPSKTVVIKGEKQKFDVIVSTISPDILFENCYGELPYIGRELLKIVLPIEFAFPEHVYFCYYANQETFTRIVEYKKFTLHKAPTTLITIEIPSKKNKLYPLPFESEKARAKKYFDQMPDGVYSIGRAGAYLYNVDIDDAIDHAMQTVARIRG
jgi:UDP-galactopyranose mutase